VESAKLRLELGASGVVERCEGEETLCEALLGVVVGQGPGRAVLGLRDPARRQPSPTTAFVRTEADWLRPSVSLGSRVQQDILDCAVETGVPKEAHLALQLTPEGQLSSSWMETDHRSFASCVTERTAGWTFPCVPSSEHDLLDLELTFSVRRP
jgi:hypothetical protein